MQKKIDRADELFRVLHEHNHRYYVEFAPTINDMEYDFLLRELRELEDVLPGLPRPNSPTQIVGCHCEKCEKK